MQCWGDDDGTEADNPGHPPSSASRARRSELRRRLERLYSDPLVSDASSPAPAGPTTTRASAFSTPQGQRVDAVPRGRRHRGRRAQTDPNFNPSVGGNFWLNPYFNRSPPTRSPVRSPARTARAPSCSRCSPASSRRASAAARSRSRSPEATKMPKCWIVVVPRGDPADGTRRHAVRDRQHHRRVDLAAVAHRVEEPHRDPDRVQPGRLAVRARRRGTTHRRQRDGAARRRQLAAVAVRQQRHAAALLVRPDRRRARSSAARLRRAKVAPEWWWCRSRSTRPTSARRTRSSTRRSRLSGVVIGFNIERNPKAGCARRGAATRGRSRRQHQPHAAAGGQAADPVVPLAGHHPWRPRTRAPVANEPGDLGHDPDFLRFNPEFELSADRRRRTFSGLQMPAGNSDAAAAGVGVGARRPGGEGLAGRRARRVGHDGEPGSTRQGRR